MKGQTNRHIKQGRLQRRLRNNATDAERLLWRHLRGRQLDGCKFRRQHPFADYVLDFVCLERMVAVELDGGQHAEQLDADELRSVFLRKAGFRVLRFWNNQVFEETDGVLEVILGVLLERRGYGEHHPHPSPPLEGEGAKVEPLLEGEEVNECLKQKPSPSRGGLGGDGVQNPPNRSNPLMFGYYLQLALRRCRKSPAMVALLVLTM
ncbi:MAG TPA: DUF559 domain-containing protein, partial [Oleiagrimonas sp.]|nr:DUF559 domain-containing protein [Oleiagrimonas sp.]